MQIKSYVFVYLYCKRMGSWQQPSLVCHIYCFHISHLSNTNSKEVSPANPLFEGMNQVQGLAKDFYRWYEKEHVGFFYFLRREVNELCDIIVPCKVVKQLVACIKGYLSHSFIGDEIGVDCAIAFCLLCPFFLVDKWK